VQFQDGAGSVKQSFSISDFAVFYVRDDSLATVATSTARWTTIGAPVSIYTWWSLSTGEPGPAVYALSLDSLYDPSTPANTPLRGVPTAAVDGVATLLTDFDALTGEFTLANVVNAGSTLQVSFAFEVPDKYDAERHRVNVTSASDSDGEWVSISEVASETDAGASPTSALFRGQVLLGGSEAALAPGDGAVWVRPGDVVTVAYYGATGTAVVGAHQVAVVSPTPIPFATPVPATDWLYLVLLAGVFALGIGWRRRSLNPRR
jgi:hypothetical protein